MGRLVVSPVYASDHPDLSAGDWIPTRVNPTQLHVSAAGDIAVHYVGDPTGDVSVLTFNPPTKTFEANCHIDTIYQVGTTVSDSDILVVGMPFRMGIQKLFGIVHRAHGVPAPGARVTAQIEGYFMRKSKGIQDQQVLETTSNAAGYWELYVAYGARVLVVAEGRNEIYFATWLVIRPTDEANIMSYIVDYT